MSQSPSAPKGGLDNSLDDSLSRGLGARLASPAGEGAVLLPSLSFAASAEYLRIGEDLLLRLGDQTLLIEGYFAAGEPPLLVTPDGSRLSVDMVASFLQKSEGESELLAANFLQKLLGIGSKPLPAGVVGLVDILEGDVLVMREGVGRALKEGDPVFEEDIVITAPEGALKIVFSDGTLFSLGGGGRIAIETFNFNSDSSRGEQVLSILKGVFTFASGLIAQDDPAHVQMRTPIGVIGIRGTKVVGEIDPDKEEVSVTVLEGRVLFETTQGETIELNQGFETLRAAAREAGLRAILIAASRTSEARLMPTLWWETERRIASKAEMAMTFLREEQAKMLWREERV